jgi:NAD(P)-dependent dehydrogenase (short-subunit alcohol dehydrogenase family)
MEKTVIITGVSREMGLGYETARQLKELGFKVIITARDFDKVSSLGITKLALNGLTVKVATQLKESKIKINSVDPGFTATYPGTENYGARPVSEGAKSIVWAVTIPDDGPSGEFFRDGQTLSW